MGAYVIDSRLFADQFSTPAMRRIFSDDNVVQKWLDVETALARVEGRLGIIPEAAAANICRHATLDRIDIDELKREMDRISHPIVPLLRQIKKVCDGDAGEYVHWGATTQDIIDTGSVLQLREALDEIEAGYHQLLGHVCDLAERHRATTMVGRSHGQHALPTTFGFKAAGWASEIGRDLDRLRDMRGRAIVGQFSGAVGTLAALEPRGGEVQRELMAELGLPCPEITWHTSRDGIAELVCVLAICTSTVGKIAQEVYALQKTDVGELEEPFSPGKVGSSTMPHKRNPPTCETVVAIAKIVRSIAPLAIEAMLSEHERDKIAQQTEREFLSRACCLADAAVRKMIYVVRDLSVRTQNMRANLTRQNGLLMSEPVMMALGAVFGRQEAHEMVYEVCMKVFEAGGTLKDGLLAHPVIAKNLTADAIDTMLDPDRYTGDAAATADRVVAAARARLAANVRAAAP